MRVDSRYLVRWNLQYSSFSRASSGHCQPSPLRYRHWMRGLSITEVMLNPTPLKYSWLPTDCAVDSLPSHCIVPSGRSPEKGQVRVRSGARGIG